jgi:hypothetical protein
MATQQTVVVDIGPDGIVSTDVKGVKGRSCLDVTKVLLEALGKVTKTDPKPEMNEKATENVKIGG